MIKKVLDVSAVFIFISFLCVDISYAQAPQRDKVSDQEWASRKGKAVSVINVSGYTYIELEGEGGPIWIAAPTMEVKVGDIVLASGGIEMSDHYSKTLERTFPVIHFVGRAETESGKTTKKGTKKGTKKVKTFTSPVGGSITKANGGYTLRELFDNKKELEGKKVSVRGKVVRVPGEIMGKIWFHLQDGTGADSNLDLVVTSMRNVEVDSIVLVAGVLGLDKDFGQGYKYDVILEDAEIKSEEIDIEKPKTSASPIKGSIAKAKGGYTLKELFDKKERLGGKKVAVRGKVVKASGKIMGKRWFHLQDGTGSKGALDLVLTSDNDADAGDIVLVTGILELGKDFGQGYKYDVIIEDAKIKIE